VAALVLSGCNDILSNRYGMQVEFLDANEAPSAFTNCPDAQAGTGSIDRYGRIMECAWNGAGYTWRLVPERSDDLPLLLVYGDSLALESREAITAAIGPGWLTEYRVYGGTAPCDWSTNASRDIRAFRPDVVVAAFAGNTLTACTMPGGVALTGAALAELYHEHLEIIAEAGVSWGARVILTSAPIPSNPLFIDRAALVTQAAWSAAQEVASTGAAVYASDDGIVFLDPNAAAGSRRGAQNLPCKTDGSEAGSCVEGFVPVHSPDGLHLCPVGMPPSSNGACDVRNIGAERFATAVADSVRAVMADAPLPHRTSFADHPLLPADDIVTLAPARLLDTRPGGPTADGLFTGIGQRVAGTTTEVQVVGRAGIPADATAVALNLTAAQAQSAGFVTVFRCDAPQPATSNLNFAAGRAIANSTFAQLSASGTICLFTSAATDLVVDVNGWLPASTSLATIGPARLMETRPNGTTTDGRFNNIGLRAAGSVTQLAIAGRGGLSVDATAAVVNITATGAQGRGFVTVYSCDVPRPMTSNLNVTAGQSVANSAIVALSAADMICIFTSVTIHLVIDAAGTLPHGTEFGAAAPARLMDTRGTGDTIDGRFERIGRRTAGSVTELFLVGRGGLPADATAVTLNITATGALGRGFVTIWSCDLPRPTASTLNVVSGTTTANSAIAEVGLDGSVCLYTSVTTDLIVDVGGWFPHGQD